MKTKNSQTQTKIEDLVFTEPKLKMFNNQS